MRVLLDECLPQRLRRHLPGHDVKTVPEMGWSGKKNGELVALIPPNAFEVLLTVDQNPNWQTYAVASGFAIVVLSAVSNRYEDLLPLMDSTLVALTTIQAGEVVRIPPA
jgi:predicted nuclease of predicted toxin-antitoxin system